jgi:TolA-binding protein
MWSGFHPSRSITRRIRGYRPIVGRQTVLFPTEGSTVSEIKDRLDRLESLVDQQQETIEQQRATIQRQRQRIDALESDPPARDTSGRENTNGEDSDGEDAGNGDGDESSSTDGWLPGAGPVSRRSLLQGAAVLGLGSFATGAAKAAEPRGVVGTDTHPVRRLYLKTLTGPVTDGTALDTVDGDGLTISNGALDVDAGAGLTTDTDTLSVDAGDGLANTEGTLGVDAGTGLALTETGTLATDLTDVGDGQSIIADSDDGSLALRTLDGEGSVDVDVDPYSGAVTISGTDTNTNTNTQTDVSDDGSTVVSSTGDINFGANLSASDDGDGTATVDADVQAATSWADGDSDGLLAPSGSKTGIEVTDLRTDSLSDDGSGQVTVGSVVDLAGNDLVDDGTTLWDSSSGHVPQGRLEHASLTVAGNSVTLGGSTALDHADLSNVNADDHHTRPSAGNALADNSNTFDVQSGGIGTTELNTPFADLATLVGTPVTAGGNLDLGGNKLTNTPSINGAVTGNTEITDLVGSGLSINSGSLEVTGSGLWTDSGDDGLLNPSDAGDNGIAVTNVQTDTLTDDGSGDVTMGNGLDLDGNDVSISDSFNFHINTGSWPYVAFTDTNSQSEVRIDWDQDFVELHRTDLRIRDSGVVEDDTGATHLTFNSGGPFGVNQTLDLNSNRISNAKEIHSDNSYITLKGSADLNLDGTELTERSGSMSVTSVNGVSVDLDTDSTSADGNSDFSVTKHGGATALFTVNDRGDVDVHNGDLDLNGNKLTDTTGELTIDVNSQRAMRVYEPDTAVSTGGSTNKPPNLIFGHGDNDTGNTEVHGATIGGGGDEFSSNTVEGDYATVGGGETNKVTAEYGTIGGGQGNTAKQYATVAGGASNDATGEYSTVPGGTANFATGKYSFAAGRKANTQDSNYNIHNGAFVWGDGTSNKVRSEAAHQVVFQAGGGMKVYTDSDTSNNTGAELPSGAGSWTSLSSKTAKSDIEPVDPSRVLDHVNKLDIASWRYNAENEDVRHMGPMAEDFYDAFALGQDEKRISNVDADGVALAAIQGLSENLDAKDARIEDQHDRIDALEVETESLREETDDLREENDRLRERNAELESRLDAIESHLGLGDTQESVADD